MVGDEVACEGASPTVGEGTPIPAVQAGWPAASGRQAVSPSSTRHPNRACFPIPSIDRRALMSLVSIRFGAAILQVFQKARESPAVPRSHPLWFAERPNILESLPPRALPV